MKTLNKILTVALAGLSVASCADLDTEYLGEYVTTDQKQGVLEANPEMALAGVTGCFSAFVNNDADRDFGDFDFGYAGVMMMLDSKSQDFAGKYSGYNWFFREEAYTGCNDTGDATSLFWKTIYGQINVANNVLSTIPADTEDAELMFFRGQGLALRAFDYWALAQMYQFNYSLDPSAPCVPIITDENMAAVAAEGAPRASVQEVYDRILADIDEAIVLLGKSGVDPTTVIENKPKRMISVATAYGIRARVYLAMHKYKEAADDAQAAINNFAGRPYSLAEVSQPAFSNINDASWMWGIAMAETDGAVQSGILNFPSHMGSFNYGYCQYGGWRWINLKLYESIPGTDVRKGWWLDGNYQSANLTAAQTAYLSAYIDEAGVTYEGQTNSTCIMPYTQVKYAPYQNVLGQSTNASDIPLMRIEEMYLTLAEATGMSSGVGAGKPLLESFVKTYRDPSYTCAATSAEEFQDECWRQRRIELWGEGMAYYDMMRLNKGMDRVGGLFPVDFTYRLEPGDPALLYCIPLDEITSNKQISSDQNNKSASRPTPITDKSDENTGDE